MNRTGIVRDERYIEHITDDYHPENPNRLRAIYAMLRQRDMEGNFTEISPRFATREELGMVHLPSYIDLISSTSGQPTRRLDPDTLTSPKSYEAACLAAGGVLEAIEMVLQGKLDNAFALIRPPGHHAEGNRAMGFCIFNNIAIGAKYVFKTHGLEKVLIIDWDVHHGNGTQNTFYEDPKVLYFSTHRYDFFYPGTGAPTEVGIGQGEGFTVNVPMSPGCGDAEYANIFLHILKPIALSYNPQLILISAGFDTHSHDPLGGMSMTEKGYARLTNITMDIAQATCGGKIIIALEGGYDLDGLATSVKAVLRELRGDSIMDITECQRNEENRYGKIEGKLEQLKSYYKRYWENR
ncbi:MAG: histone deacetylase [Syntrophobacterales bacterium]|nr:MAG: histone deacetylase [Syntrophobacterales bacterium]